MILRQLFDYETYTYTYILGDSASREAAIIDSVKEQSVRDLRVLEELGLKLKFILDTHLHADHITGASLLREATGAKVMIGKASGVSCADLLLEDGAELKLGKETIRAIATPGHTNTCTSFYIAGCVFTGDTLFVRDVGRTDFQEGSNEKMYESVTEKLFRLPDDTRVFPAHDYKGNHESSIKEEKAFNLKVGGGKTFAEFKSLMDEMKRGLTPPKKIAIALPANRNCGKDSAVR
ncbi:MAG: MBL fold metallo-hydrolase [Bdellovibrionota bacterium]